jgi:hypothetical protein
MLLLQVKSKPRVQSDVSVQGVNHTETHSTLSSNTIINLASRYQLLSLPIRVVLLTPRPFQPKERNGSTRLHTILPRTRRSPTLSTPRVLDHHHLSAHPPRSFKSPHCHQPRASSIDVGEARSLAAVLITMRNSIDRGTWYSP